MTIDEATFRTIVLAHARRLGYSQVDIKRYPEGQLYTLSLARPDQPDQRSVTVFSEDALISVNMGKLAHGVGQNIDEACSDPIEDRKRVPVPLRAALARP